MDSLDVQSPEDLGPLEMTAFCDAARSQLACIAKEEPQDAGMPPSLISSLMAYELSVLDKF